MVEITFTLMPSAGHGVQITQLTFCFQACRRACITKKVPVGAQELKRSLGWHLLVEVYTKFKYSAASGGKGTQADPPPLFLYASPRTPPSQINALLGVYHPKRSSSTTNNITVTITITITIIVIIAIEGEEACGRFRGSI